VASEELASPFPCSLLCPQAREGSPCPHSPSLGRACLLTRLNYQRATSKPARMAFRKAIYKTTTTKKMPGKWGLWQSLLESIGYWEGLTAENPRATPPTPPVPCTSCPAGFSPRPWLGGWGTSEPRKELLGPQEETYCPLAELQGVWGSLGWGRRLLLVTLKMNALFCRFGNLGTGVPFVAHVPHPSGIAGELGLGARQLGSGPWVLCWVTGRHRLKSPGHLH
jgi:hypothetical protein